MEKWDNSGVTRPTTPNARTHSRIPKLVRRNVTVKIHESREIQLTPLLPRRKGAVPNILYR